MLREFVQWFNKAAADKDFSPVIAAAICHFWFVWVHPFCDGNGRTGRLLTTFMLLKKKSEGIRYFALSDYYNRNKDSYYDALEKTNRCNPEIPAMTFEGSLDLWVEYFVHSYLEQMKTLKEVTNRILQLHIRVARLRQSGTIAESHNKVLSFLSSREKASYGELKQHLGGVSKQRVHQILQPLRAAHILVEETIGSLKWFKLGSPEEETNESILINPVKKRLKTEVKKSPKNKFPQAPTQKILPIFENLESS